MIGSFKEDILQSINSNGRPFIRKALRYLNLIPREMLSIIDTNKEIITQTVTVPNEPVVYSAHMVQLRDGGYMIIAIEDPGETSHFLTFSDGNLAFYEPAQHEKVTIPDLESAIVQDLSKTDWVAIRNLTGFA
jgi:hypothetical protein